MREDKVGQPIRVGGFELDLRATQWWHHNNARHQFAAITTQHQGPQRSTVEAETGLISYTVQSGYCRPLAPRGVATLFRDPTGLLIGGSFHVDTRADRCLPGSSTESIGATRSIPPDIDDSRTQSYPYCDPSLAAPDPTDTDPPVN